MNNSLGEKIKMIRLEKGLTMEEFGRIFNTSKGTINNWEKSRNKPNRENLKKIAELGNTTVDELLNNGKSDIETVIEESDPKKVGKVVKYIRSIWSDSIESFVELINEHLRLIKNKPELSIEDYLNFEEGVTVPRIEVATIIANLEGISIKNFYSGNIEKKYSKDAIRNYIKRYNLNENIDEQALDDLTNALNQAKVANFSAPDILFIYQLNTTKQNDNYIKDRNSLIKYLEKKAASFSAEEGNDNLSDEIKADLWLQTAELINAKNAIEIYAQVFEI